MKFVQSLSIILSVAATTFAQFDFGGFGGFGGGGFDMGGGFGGGAPAATAPAATAPAAGGGGGGSGTDVGYTGPECEDKSFGGAFYTGDYTSPFKSILGKTDAEIQDKLDALWGHYFKGDDNSKVFFDNGSDGYILDVNNNDVRSEGMSYGMMITVQTGHKAEFDKLWSWAKGHMWHKGDGWDGYFAWKRGANGQGGDDNCAPDGEMYFMMSLLFAANRWGDSGYMDDAQYILKAMWENGQHSLFNQQTNIITFQPQGEENNFSDPSYDLPAFLDLFSRWSQSNQDRWGAACKATRDHLYKSSNPQSGLFSDYNNFDGTPHGVSYNGDAEKYMYDAMRCAMNFGMDYYLFGADAERQTEMAKRIIDHFERDGYSHGRFNWDGSGGMDSYTLGEKGANAVACYALIGVAGYEDAVKKNLQMAWEAEFLSGQFRYYDGLVHYLSMLHLCGSFKIWKPQPAVSCAPAAAPAAEVAAAPAAEVAAAPAATVPAAAAQPAAQPAAGGLNLSNSVPITNPNNVGIFTNPMPAPATAPAATCNQANIISMGYPCCSSACTIVETNAYGSWGMENNQWCGCDGAPAGAAACTGKLGYPCCLNTIQILYTDTDGYWGMENNNYCFLPFTQVSAQF